MSARRPGTRLMAVTGVLLVILLSAGAYLAIEQFDSGRARVRETFTSEAQVAAARVDQFIAERFESLETIAQAPVVRSGDAAAIKAWFEELVDGGSSFTGGLSLIRPDGTLILLSGFPLDAEPIDLSDRDYVQAVRATGRPALGNAIVGRVSGDPLVSFAVPVPGAGGGLSAILAGTIRLDLPGGGLARIGASLTDTVILDGLGQVVADRGVVAELGEAHPSLLAQAPTEAGWVGELLGPDGSAGWSGATAPVGSTDWWVAVLRPSSEVWGPGERSRDLQFIALGLLGALGLGSAWVVARGLDRGAKEDSVRSEAAAERERFLREFADALPAIAGILDADLRPEYANLGFRARTSTDLRELVHPDDVERLPAPDDRGSVSVDLRFRDPAAPDGYRWHRARFAPALEPGKARWFFAAVEVDEQKRAEFGLQSDIAERDEFLGLVSHELRTPLTVIVGTALTLLRARDTLPSKVAEGLDDIQTSARRLQRVLENMLVMSRLGSTESADDIEPQLLPRLIEATVKDFQSFAPERRLILSIDRDTPIVSANRSYVEQVVWNLLTNAHKYSDTTTPIELDVRPVERAVAISVRDRGPGIPADEQGAIFEPHHRTSSGRASAGGLGLGLSVCRRLVERQGGTIEVSSREGGGSVFTFTLPAAEE